MCESSLDEAAIAFARENLGESDAVVKDSVKNIQQFLKDHPKVNGRSDHRTVLFFLRSCKFNIEQTETKIKK